ncbi:hypothetical protein [Octadecabacter ascidiaceicola]|uniref:Lipoprotein n=1 Tax=Octadecabacter ascidiaceicola TaxID=1655543 RepID=A0A238JUE8_9RHOB|nr:hypothetical protein [Octadecabacter ascidiaceicola]SMX33452.1 hypothetical protein OCA8868_00956 [Octadecabacter ascidiaceicola]
MKCLSFVAAVATLSGCMEPVYSVQGAIPFAQVLAETEGRPYECVDYEPSTNSCSSISQFVTVGPNAFQLTTTSRPTPHLPAIELTTVMRERGAVMCSDRSNMDLRFAQAGATFQMEAVLAQVEIAIAEDEQFCGGYVRAGDNYIFRVVSGAATETKPIQNIQFFAEPKRLRVEE